MRPKRPKKHRRTAPGSKEQRKVVRVLAEGKVTEPQYLRAVAGHEVQIAFGATGFTPMALVEQARLETKANRRADDFDEIWCVFDYDEHPDIARAIHEARQSGIDTAMSNPCFELWLVLHVEEQRRHIHRHAAQRRCRDLRLTDGKKITASGLSQLRDGYDAAKRRAESLERMHEQTGSPKGSNPSSGVWRLVDRLRQVPAAKRDPARPSAHRDPASDSE